MENLFGRIDNSSNSLSPLIPGFETFLPLYVSLFTTRKKEERKNTVDQFFRRIIVPFQKLKFPNEQFQ